MKYELVQYQCNECGNLTDVMDCDEPLPKGWTYGNERNTHYCPECSNKLKEK